MQKITHPVIVCNKRLGECYELREWCTISSNNIIMKMISKQVELTTATEYDKAWKSLLIASSIKYPWDPSLPEYYMYMCDSMILNAHNVPKYHFTKTNFTDYWQFAPETVAWNRGDCEDKALVCYAVLQNLQLETYWVLGAVQIDDKLYGHSWTQVTIDNTSYILETTLPEKYLLEIGEQTYFEKMRTDRLYGKLYIPYILVNNSDIYLVNVGSFEEADNMRSRMKRSILILDKLHRKLF